MHCPLSVVFNLLHIKQALLDSLLTLLQKASLLLSPGAAVRLLTLEIVILSINSLTYKPGQK